MTLNSFFLGGLITTILSGCTAYQYIPSHHYVNLHKEKGEVNVNVNVLPSGIQAGYSVTDNFFVFGTAYSRQKNSKPYQQKEGGGYESHQGSSNELDLGVGYIYRKGKTIFEIMAGGGTGRMDYSHHIDLGSSDYNFSLKTRKNNFFIEPLFGFAINQYVEMGVFSRLNSVDYFHASTTASSINLKKADLAFVDRNDLNVLFLEPGLFFNVGWENVKFNFQLGGSDEIRGPDIRNQSRIFRSGLSVKLGPKSKN